VQPGFLQPFSLLLLAAASALHAEAAPTLTFSSYLGGSDVDLAFAMATDGGGFVYVAGVTLSDDFPDPHPLPQAGPRHDVFVVKLDPAGRLVWSARFGGSRNELPNGIAAAGDRVWVSGWTDSGDFPRLGPLAGQPATVTGDHDLFVTALDAADGSLLASTNLGGTRDDYGEGIAVDARGDVYVTGGTSSQDFPVLGGFPASGSNHYKAFVTKISANGSRLLYSILLGGTDPNDAANGQEIAVDAGGHALVAGLTSSHDFPAVHAAQAAWGGGFSEGFVAKLAPAGDALVWSTFLGGNGEERLQGIAVDGAGRVWVTGSTTSSNFPVRAAFQPHLRGESDAVVTGFGPGGELIASTYLGGGQDEVASSIQVDAAGGLRVAGGTGSADFPVLHPVQGTCGMPEPYCSDAFVAELRPGAAGLVWATYLGGQDASYAYAVAAGPDGSTWAAGVTEAFDFPQVAPLQRFAAGIADAWVARIDGGASDNHPPDCTRAAARPVLLWPPNGKLRAISISGVTDPDGDSPALRVTAIRQDEPLSKKGQPDATGIGTTSPLLRADRAGSGDGRVYHLSFTSTDLQNASCAGTVTVCVPHDQGQRTCGDGGPLFTSNR
jgi:hypothetical protein